MNINGFELPAALEATLHAGSHKLSPNQTAHLKMLLKRINIPDPKLYGYDSIARENKLWAAEHVKFYLGTPNLQCPPGNVDPRLTLIIGEAEPDSPIALDYRTAEPRVIYFCDIDQVNCWVELSPTYEALMKIIGAA